jgi:undecaprenyl-diphosphatase
MLAITMIGGGWAIVLAGPFIAWPRTRRAALWLTAAVIAQSALVWAIKQLVARVRPFRALGTRPPFDAPSDHSFPSGHAAGSFTVAVFLATVVLSSPSLRHRHWYATVALLVAFAIALSRVYLGVHYPGDVTAGALIGGAFGFTAARLYLRDLRARARASTERKSLDARL